jgi:histidyl-tRNA synthetase
MRQVFKANNFMSNKRNQKLKKKLKKIKGSPFSDILPKEESYWENISNVAKSVSKLHGFSFINTSLLDKYEIYEKAYKEEEKEKLEEIFKTKIDKENLCLRYSFRESVLRSYVENKLSYFSTPLKVFYVGKVFRNGEVNEYFLKEFHQLGFQVLGESDEFYDGEIIIVMYDFFRRLKLNNLVLKIGNAGCKNCSFVYKKKLQNYYYDKLHLLCKSCRKYFPYEVFKLLDCKEESCLKLKEGAPSVFNSLCLSCNNYMKYLMEVIEDNEIPYEVDDHLVGRSSLENRIVFEFYVPEIPYPLAFGSRYDALSEKIYKKRIPLVGGNIGIERTIKAMIKKGIKPETKEKPKVAFLLVGPQAKKGALKLMSKLRLSGVGVLEFASKRSLEAQIKTASRLGIKLGVIIGQKEVFEGTVILRDMLSGSQEVVLADKLEKEIKKKLSQKS